MLNLVFYTLLLILLLQITSPTKKKKCLEKIWRRIAAKSFETHPQKKDRPSWQTLSINVRRTVKTSLDRMLTSRKQIYLDLNLLHLTSPSCIAGTRWNIRLELCSTYKVEHNQFLGPDYVRVIKKTYSCIVELNQNNFRTNLSRT